MLSIETVLLPSSPGTYKFFNNKKTLIYVGKAKNIKKRISSYFGKQSQPNRKVKKLISEIKGVEYIITNTEYDALLLENNLIKQYQPKYNILLKDGKTYPYLCITKEPFPKILSTRKYIPEKGEYFGPYTSVGSMNNMLDLLHRLYCIRTCNFVLSKENITRKKLKICLEYHIKNCKGPCIGLQNEESYNSDIAQVKNILKGNLATVTLHLTAEMKHAADTLQFERAAMYKNKLDLLQKFQDESLVVNKKITEVDVITITSSSKHAFINYMQIKEGIITLSENIEIIKKMNESDENLLNHTICESRKKHHSVNTLILSNKPITIKSEKTENNIPKIGDKRKLVVLSLKNALSLRKIRETSQSQNKSKKEKLLAILKQELRLNNLPRVIECFDVSNLHGSFPVASMVCFTDGISKKSGYRHYNIKTVKGPNDFASIKEIVLRRYHRLMKENKSLPNLIIIDGGKGQLSSACEALKELRLSKKIPIISIAKKLEEIYYPNDPIPMHLDKRSASLLLIQKIRNEAHRFAVTFHRLKRDKGTITTKIEGILGIGNKTTNKLLTKFKSWEKIKKTTLQELEKVIGKQKTHLIASELAKEKVLDN